MKCTQNLNQTASVILFNAFANFSHRNSHTLIFIFILLLFFQQESESPKDDVQQDPSPEEIHQSPDADTSQTSEDVSAAATTHRGDDAEPSPSPGASRDSPPPSPPAGPAALTASAASSLTASALLESDTIDLDAMPEAWLSAGEDVLSAPGAGEAIDAGLLAVDLPAGLRLEGEGEGEGAGSDVRKQD